MRGWQGRWVVAEREYKVKVMFCNGKDWPFHSGAIGRSQSGGLGAKRAGT